MKDARKLLPNVWKKARRLIMEALYVYMIVNKENYKFMNSNALCDDTFNIVKGIRFQTYKRAESYLNNFINKENYKIVKVKLTIEE